MAIGTPSPSSSFRCRRSSVVSVLVLQGRDNVIVRARELLTDAVGVSASCGAYGVTDMGRRLLDTARLP